MKENSIEEDIKIAEHFIKSIKTDKEYKEDGWHGYFNEEIVELARILEHILSDYKRVLKENEELKQDRNNNYQMIALAQNEMLGYMQGYEDGKKLKRSAVANIVENQQYYIIKKQIEHYIEYIEKLQKENEELKADNYELNNRITDLLENIPVQKVKDKIEKLSDESHAEELEDIMNRKNYTITELVQYVLQELLEK